MSRLVARHCCERKPSLAIVGGGLAGLISCRVALSSGKYDKVRVFEKDPFFGGNWTPSSRRRETGARTVYEDLRVNLPTILMGDPAFPWKRNWTESFPQHTEFREYIRYYFDEVIGSEGQDCFRFGQQVENVRRDRGANTYRVTTNSTDDSFDHVLVCTGHFDVPYIPSPFVDTLPCALHSKFWETYKDSLQDKDVILVGFGPSALDFGSHLSATARTLHWVHSTFDAIETDEENNASGVHWWTRIDMTPGKSDSVRLYGRGSDSYRDVNVVSHEDDHRQGCVVIFATGYGYDHSFLEPALRPLARDGVDVGTGGKEGVPTKNLVRIHHHIFSY